MLARNKARNIIVIEYDSNTSNLLSDILSRNGYQVIDEAWEGKLPEGLVSNSHIACILVSLRQHLNKSGYDVLSQLRAIEELKDIPIVAVTGADQSTVQEAKTAGFDGFISKPIRPYILRELVNKVVLGESVWV